MTFRMAVRWHTVSIASGGTVYAVSKRRQSPVHGGSDVMKSIHGLLLALGLAFAGPSHALEFGWCAARVTGTDVMAEQDFRFVFHIVVAALPDVEDIKAMLSDQVLRDFDLRNVYG